MMIDHILLLVAFAAAAAATFLAFCVGKQVGASSDYRGRGSSRKARRRGTARRYARARF